MDKEILKKLILPLELEDILQEVQVIVPRSRQELLKLSMGNREEETFEVSYEVPNKGKVVEATVVKCKNGFAINYEEAYMRRRDPNCMILGDDKETDKQKYSKMFSHSFEELREDTFAWLKDQKELIVMPFMAGGENLGYEALLVAPSNAGFFATALLDLQGFIPQEKIRSGFCPKAIIYLAPSFRHTHFNGKQIVVHNRLDTIHEVFSYNLYPGPSAKKGIYGVLLHIGEQEGWVTLHGSTVKIITPYEQVFTIMHEGASGGGKSEMIEQFHRQEDGRVLLGENIITKEKHFIEMADTCELQPVTDDMAINHPSLQRDKKKLVVKDAEEGWFLRINHITEYGTEPHIEKMTIYPKEPLLFLNIDGKPGSTCLIWEHTMDDVNQPCPNPRVILPRKFVPNIINDPVEIDIRSFGVRTPPTTKEMPNYGIIGMFHVIPPALAWLWRLVAPRGHSNPSITDTEGLSSEGVGSYWPFATGKMVTQANLLLKQILITPDTKYVLIPNQFIGAYEVGFMPQWIGREYFSRRGNVKFKIEDLVVSRCPLLGYSLNRLKIDGSYIPKGLLQVQYQPEVGVEGYDAGDKLLKDFFKKELLKFMTKELNPLGREIIEICMKDGSVEDYKRCIPME